MLDFDWYQATVTGETDHELVISHLLYDCGPVVLKSGSGGFNRSHSARGDFPGGGSLAIYWGDDQDVHVVGSSAAAPHVAQVLRSLHPNHTVSRADVAYDVDQRGAFDRLYKVAHLLAGTPRRGRRMGTSLAGDWLDSINGRTLYAGGPTSRLRVRVYEKGHEQRAKHPDRLFSLDWARVEWQIRPDSAGKRRAATATPAELAAWTSYGAELLQAVTSLGLTPTAPARVASTNPEFWMARQYSAILREWALVPDLAHARILAALDLVGSTPNTPARPPQERSSFLHHVDNSDGVDAAGRSSSTLSGVA